MDTIVLLDLMGGVALLLWGLHMVRRAALLWAERMRQGRRREDANLRERAKMGLERRPYRANSGRMITTIGEWLLLSSTPTIGASSGLA
jgi:hypothetical protein